MLFYAVTVDDVKLKIIIFIEKRGLPPVVLILIKT